MNRPELKKEKKNQKRKKLIGNVVKGLGTLASVVVVILTKGKIKL